MRGQRFNFRPTFTSTLAGFLLAASTGCATSAPELTPYADRETGIATESPYSLQDESWVSLDGRVAMVRSDRFVLDYGQGTITVEMDGAPTAEPDNAFALRPDDEVVVTGRIDSDLLEKTTIEARSVFVARTGTDYHASPRDDEELTLDHGFWPTVVKPVDVSRVVVRGTVIATDNDFFLMHSAAGAIRIDVSSMPVNPVEDGEFQRVTVGDRVSVTGRLGYGFFERKELAAQAVSVLRSAALTNR